MSARLIGTVLLLALVTALPAQGQEKYTFKFAKLKQGDVLLVEKVDEGDSKTNIVDKEGKLLKEGDNKKVKTKYAFRETILEKAVDAKKATRLKRHYLQAQETTNGTTGIRPYQDKTVLIEKKDGKYRFHLEGEAELRGKDAEKFEDEFNKQGDHVQEFEVILGEGKAAAVGETWKLDLATIEKSFGGKTKFPLDPTATKATAQLVKAYKKDGRQFGVLKIDLVLVVKATTGKTSDGKDIAVEPGSKFTVLMDMDVCIDGTSDLGTRTIRTEADVTLRVPDMPQLRYVITGKGQSTEHHKAPVK